MPRPITPRRIGFQPDVTYFKPAGKKLIELEETILSMEEFEAIRLKDLEGLEQEEAAKKMNVSQPTFNRVLKSGRKKIAEAIVKGKAIRIEGGTYFFSKGFGRGFGRGRGRGFRGKMRT